MDNYSAEDQIIAMTRFGVALLGGLIKSGIDFKTRIPIFTLQIAAAKTIAQDHVTEGVADEHNFHIFFSHQDQIYKLVNSVSFDDINLFKIETLQ